jgi:hypothetical protein
MDALGELKGRAFIQGKGGGGLHREMHLKKGGLEWAI